MVVIVPLLTGTVATALFFLMIRVSLADANEFLPPANSTCACPKHNLTFTCSVVGGVATFWTGSAFNCSGNNNEIILLHNLDEGTTRDCNDGAIIGRSLGVEGNQFTSQLIVNISNELNNKTVRCNLDSNNALTKVGETFINVISAPLEQVPNDVSLTNVATGRLTFTWNAADTTCPSINYLPSSNCTTWSCVNPTGTTTAICSGLQLPSVCTFTVQTEVCGQVGLPSEPISVILKVPEKPTLDIIPVYSAETKDLLHIKAVINKQASYNITDAVLSSVTFYSISYNSATPLPFDQNTPCMEDVCEYLIGVPSDLCQSSSDISVALSASNRLGQGPPSDPTTIECTNQFVEVEYDRTASTITCRFLDESDTSIKLCTVMYGECGQELVQTTQGSSTMETPNDIILSVDANVLECYSVTASSDLVTVIVESDVNSEEKGPDVVVIVVVIVVVAIAVSVVVVITVVFIMRRKRSSGNGAQPITTMQLEDRKLSTSDKDSTKSADDVEDRFKLKRLSQYDFQKFNVAHDCELRGYVESELKLVKEFKISCVFYEFKHEFESISDDQELIFKNKKYHDSYWKVGHKDPLIGLQVKKPNFEDYDVFVQCTGSGVQHLPANSRLLCQISGAPQSRPDPPLKPIVPFNIRSATVSTTMIIKNFCEYNEIPTKYGVFLELGKFKKKSDCDLLDVILQDKESGVMYTGPTASEMVKQYYADHDVPDLNRWWVFVLCKIDEKMEIQADSKILYQAPEFTHLSTEVFDVLTVDESENFMSLCDFIKKKPEINEFTNGHAFYELTKEEDLRYYRDVVYLAERNTTKTNIDLFYKQRDSKPPKKKGYRVFIQSISQGTRCVKAGDTILYKTIPVVAGGQHRQQPIGDDDRAVLESVRPRN